jgi:hypothetical protein
MSRIKSAAALAAAALALSWPTAHAEEGGLSALSKPDERGYSYFLGLAQQSLRYRETSSIAPVGSAVRVHSALLITGALFPIQPDLLVSMHSESTFSPGRSTEQWTATTSSLNGTTLTDPTVQSNGFSLSQSSLQLLAHQRLQQQIFGVAGLTLRQQSFKRFSFSSSYPSSVITLPTDRTIEESTSEVVLNVGAELESELVRHSNQHYGLRAAVGLPVWRRVDNTSVPDLQFNGTRGFDVELEGRYSWAVLHGAHAGVWAKYSLSRRQAEQQGSTELPENRTDSFGLGLELLWKF